MPRRSTPSHAYRLLTAVLVLLTSIVLVPVVDSVDSAAAAASVAPSLARRGLQLELAATDNSSTGCLGTGYAHVRLQPCSPYAINNWAVDTTAYASGTELATIHPANRLDACLSVAGDPQHAAAGAAVIIDACTALSTQWRLVPAVNGSAMTLINLRAGLPIAEPASLNAAVIQLTLGSSAAQWFATTSRSISHYVRNLTGVPGDFGVMKSTGCADASSDTTYSPTQQHLMVLDIGAQTIHDPLSQTNPGVLLTGTQTRLTYGALVSALQGYITGYAACFAGPGLPTIVVATNNDGAWDGPYQAAARGQDWAQQVINPLRQYAKSITTIPALTPHPVIDGGIDLEAGFASSLSEATTFESQYLGNTAADLVDIGSLDGCPQTYTTAESCAAVTDDNGVTKTWKLADYVQLTHAIDPSRIRVLPEVYYTSQAKQWAVLEQESTAEDNGDLNFLGVLTEQAACSSNGQSCGELTPPSAYTALRESLPAALRPTLAVSTDLRIS
jgi:hypothetical protein